MWNFKDYQYNLALIDESGRQITYGELEKYQSIYYGYMNFGRTLVFLICDVSIESILIYITCIQNKIPVMVLDHKISKEKIDELIELYHPKFVWHFGEAVDFINYRVKKFFENFQLFCNDEAGIPVYEQLALLLLTSGSTGSKKSVRISYRNIESNMISIAESLALTKKDAAMVMLPICYSYGLSIIHSNLFVGATLLVPKSPFFSVKFWDFFSKYHGTSICGVPYTYEVLRKLKFHEKTFPALRLITQAGGPLGIEEQKYFLHYVQKNRIDLAIMYGQTEATARISCYFLSRQKEKLGSVGKVIPNGKIEIVQKDKSGRGEIIYKGKNVSLGYAESAVDLIKGDENKEILHTGDLGYLDGEGYLYITGRKNRIAKILGVRLNLDELQELLSQKSGFQVFCVEEGGVLFAFINERDLVSNVYDAIRDIKMDSRVFEVEYINEFPREENGKISYKKISQIAKERY